MIQEISVAGFKRFADNSFGLRRLTVLAGRNGAGKTSFLHAILLAHQAIRRSDGIVELNGPYGIELGWFEELVNFDTIDSAFVISLFSENYEANLTFKAGNTELYASVDVKRANEYEPFLNDARGFQYISAERSGPRLTQTSLALPLDLLYVGSRGEYTAQIIEKLGGSIVPAVRLFPNLEAPALVKAQTEMWLSHIVRPVDIDSASFPGTDVVSLRFRPPGGEWVRPTNMGFGVSYTLPIVLAALTAPKDGILIVENPEAHLHPAGQSRMGTFLAHMANAGLQIVIETHSDHILNGIRRAVGAQDGLTAGDAVVHFFGEEADEPREILFTQTGGVSEWPAGFFDQYQLDISTLSRIKRPK